MKEKMSKKEMYEKRIGEFILGEEDLQLNLRADEGYSFKGTEEYYHHLLERPATTLLAFEVYLPSREWANWENNEYSWKEHGIELKGINIQKDQQRENSRCL